MPYYPPAGGAAAVAFTVVEVSLGTVPRLAGKFTIAGSGLTVGQPVYLQQASGPYTGKGARTDEAEMDQVKVTGKVETASLIRCFWTSGLYVRGNYKFQYYIGA